jgi:hypothetical protein
VIFWNMKKKKKLSLDAVLDVAVRVIKLFNTQLYSI